MHLRNGTIRRWLAATAAVVVTLPMLVAACVTALIAQESQAGCGGTEDVNQPAGAVVGGVLYAPPLMLQPGRSYEVGATEYGGPGDPRLRRP
jgi:hypothetical protein